MKSEKWKIPCGSCCLCPRKLTTLSTLVGCESNNNFPWKLKDIKFVYLIAAMLEEKVRTFFSVPSELSEMRGNFLTRKRKSCVNFLSCSWKTRNFPRKTLSSSSMGMIQHHQQKQTTTKIFDEVDDVVDNYEEKGFKVFHDAINGGKKTWKLQKRVNKTFYFPDFPLSLQFRSHWTLNTDSIRRGSVKSEEGLRK